MSTTTTAAQPTPGYSVSVLPMLPLGAPMGVVVFRDLDPTSSFHELAKRISNHLQSLASRTSKHTNVINMLLYRVDLSLDAFPEQPSWEFLSTMPLSQLFHGLGYPAPISYNSTIQDCFRATPGTTTQYDPPRVINLIAEAIELLSERRLPRRYSRWRRRLEDVDPVKCAQLQTFLSTAPEPVPMRSSARLAKTTPLGQSYPQDPPYVLSRVPDVAGLTLPEGKLMVRKVHEKFLNEILQDLPDKKRFVYVAATTGAGKTAFLWSILHLLCRRGRSRCGQCFTPPMDIVFDVPGLFVLIDTAGQVFTGPRGKCFRIELMKKETLYLVDLAHGDHKEISRSPVEYLSYHSGTDDSENHTAGCRDAHHYTHVGHSSRIIMCLPRRYVEFSARQHDKLDVRLLPSWKTRELELCSRVCFPALDPALLAARVKQWGHQPWFTLAMDPAEGVGELRLLHGLEDLDSLTQLMNVVWTNFIQQPQQDDVTQLFVLRPPSRVKRDWDELPAWWCFDWCSRPVRDAVIQRVLELHRGKMPIPLGLQCGAIFYLEATGWVRSRQGLRCNPKRY